jgi:hypothetical protein
MPGRNELAHGNGGACFVITNQGGSRPQGDFSLQRHCRGALAAVTSCSGIVQKVSVQSTLC